MNPIPPPGRVSRPGPRGVVPELASPTSSIAAHPGRSPVSGRARSIGPLPWARPASRAVAALLILGTLANPGTLTDLPALTNLGPLTDIGSLAGLVYASPFLALRSNFLRRTVRRNDGIVLRTDRRGDRQYGGEAQAEPSESDRHSHLSHICFPRPGRSGPL